MDNSKWKPGQESPMDSQAQELLGLSGPQSGYERAARILAEHRDRGDAIETLLEASGGQESDWLEFKAGMRLLPEDQKTNTQGDLYLDYALSVAAMVNTRGGAFVIGVDDKKHKRVPLASCDPGHVLEKEGFEGYLRKEVLDRIDPPNCAINSKGHQWHFSAPLGPHIESRSIPFQGDKVIGLLLQPCLPGSEITVDWGANESVEMLPIRKLGEVGCVKRLSGYRNIENYKKMRQGLFCGGAASAAPVQPETCSTVEAPCEGRFVGREEELERLGGLLEIGKIPVVSGAGGMGKSELVRQYAARHREDYPGGMFQIDMEGVEDWPEAFLRLLGRHSNNGVRVADCLEIKKDNPAGKEGRETKEPVLSGEEVRDALLRRALQVGPVLLVLDNIESCEKLFGDDGTGGKRMFPSGIAEGLRIDVVATTRIFDAEPGVVEQFPLGDLSLKAALELLLSQHPAGTEEERTAVEKVARLLGCRALFLRRVPGIIGAKNFRNAKMVCRSYASLAAALEKGLLPTIVRTGKVDELHLPGKMWELTRNSLAGWCFGEAAVRLVRLAAHFPAEGFPKHILRRLWDAEVFPGIGEEGLASEDAFDAVVDACQIHNIFQDTDPVRIHRLDREAILRDPEVDGPELARAVGRALSGYLGASPGVWLSLAAFPDIVRQIPPAVANGRLYARLLSENPALEELCPWETLDCMDWALLLARQPRFGNSCPWEKLTADLGGAAWAKLLETSPQFADKCPWDRMKAGSWASLISKQPQFSDKCPWDELDGWDLVPVLRTQPQLAKWCRWEKLNKFDWDLLLSNCPQFADKCPTEMLPAAESPRVSSEQPGRADADSGKKPAGERALFSPQAPQPVEQRPREMMSGGDWADLLSRAPQFAATCPWEKLDGKDWAKVLKEQPQMAVMCPWEKLGSWDWAHLLGYQPQFADKCPWEALDGLAWLQLLRVSLRFVDRCPWKKLSFGLCVLLSEQPQLAGHIAWEELNGSAWVELLRDFPQFEDKCPWNKFDGDDWVCLLPWEEDKCPWEKLESRHWARLLGSWPEYSDKCPWKQLATDLDGESWAVLICDQPQFADKCPWEKLRSRDWAVLLANQPQFADRCPWEKIAEDDFRELLNHQPQFADRRTQGAGGRGREVHEG